MKYTVIYDDAYTVFLQENHEIYGHIRCIHGIFGRKIMKCTVIYGVYIQFWPTLHM